MPVADLEFPEPRPALGRGARSFRVFVSSTSKDLTDHRAVAHRCGWVPTLAQGGNGRDSITGLELAFAREKKIPVIPLLATETWPGNLWEEEATARDWVKEFRASLNQPAAFFEHEKSTTDESDRLPQFRALLKEQLLKEKERRPRNGQSLEGAVDFFESAKGGLLDGTDVPFLGPGIYGDGPLSSGALTRALIGEERLNEEPSLATVAEYRERYLGSRKRFLRQLERVLEEQSHRVEPPQVHDLLVKAAQPPLVVSTSCDLVLEKRLEAAGRKLVIVAHVVRSDSEHDGKVVIVRPGEESVFRPADEVTGAKDEFVIYKPAGSPFLNERLGDDGIDTVVMTETDHVSLLRRLENEKTGIPKRFAKEFAREPLLFLGYALHVWQCRLMMLVYQSASRTSDIDGALTWSSAR